MEGKSWHWPLITAIAPISWGATYFLTRQFLPPDAPLWGAAWRALPAGLLLFLVARRLPTGAWWWRSILLGILNFGAFFVLIYLAAQALPTSVAASIMSLAPVVLAFMAWGLLRERVTLQLIGSAALGGIGVVLLVRFAASGADPWGVIASFTALLMSSLGAVLTTRWRDDHSLVATTAWQLIAAGILLTGLAVFVEGPPPAVGNEGLAAYAVIAVIATALAFLCWFTGFRHLPAGAVGLIGLFNPITGVALGVLLAGEQVTVWQGIGIALVLTAIISGTRRRQPQTPPRPAHIYRFSGMTRTCPGQGSLSGRSTVNSTSRSKPCAW